MNPLSTAQSPKASLRPQQEPVGCQMPPLALSGISLSDHAVPLTERSCQVQSRPIPKYLSDPDSFDQYVNVCYHKGLFSELKKLHRAIDNYIPQDQQPSYHELLDLCLAENCTAEEKNYSKAYYVIRFIQDKELYQDTYSKLLNNYKSAIVDYIVYSQYTEALNLLESCDLAKSFTAEVYQECAKAITGKAHSLDVTNPANKEAIQLENEARYVLLMYIKTLLFFTTIA